MAFAPYVRTYIAARCSYPYQKLRHSLLYCVVSGCNSGVARDGSVVGCVRHVLVKVTDVSKDSVSEMSVNIYQSIGNNIP